MKGSANSHEEDEIVQYVVLNLSQSKMSLMLKVAGAMAHQGL